LVLVVLFYLYYFTGGESEKGLTFSIIFSSIVLEAFPFLLLGTLAGGFIEVFVSRDRLASLLPRRPVPAVLLAASLGIVLPVCECAIVPVVRRLSRKGLPASAGIAYLLAGPIVNPLVALSTWLAYGMDWQPVLIRLAAGYVIAVLVALAIGRVLGEAGTLVPEARGGHPDEEEEDCHHPHHQHAAPEDGKGSFERLLDALTHGLDDFLATAPFLIIGAFLAALAQTYVERSLFLAAADNPLGATVLMMLLAVLLNLCSEADAFIAASFRGYVPLVAQLAFLVLGPMFDLKLLLMYRGLFQKKAILLLVTLVSVLVLGLALTLIQLGV
jgi:uncharacterized membrane protein YraQ (UPF0718 family)